LLDGYNILILDFYSTGLTILNELKKYLRKKYKSKSFNEERNFRNEFHKLSNHVFLEIKNNKLAVKKSPAIGWLKILYENFDSFLLSFPQVQGLNSSWQWYKNGVTVPVLKNKIYPWYGTYFPTRFEHLKLFENWLNRYSGNKETAFDIGIGSGVLTMQMLQNGFFKIYGTDINPNAIVGIREYADKNNLNSKIELFHGNLFAGCDNKVDLIVFNPPWLPQKYNSKGIDNAIYYNEDLFPDFFKEAKNHLKPNGKIVLLFSNLAELTNSDFEHPIKKELQEGRFKKELFEFKKVKQASKKTKRNITTRKDEFVELWVLKQVD
ncbi:MAG: methyltransferase, partial [Chlorobi bacterium]|nr:methyltransferase [Chlorobiota bacterium]